MKLHRYITYAHFLPKRPLALGCMAMFLLPIAGLMAYSSFSVARANSASASSNSPTTTLAQSRLQESSTVASTPTQNSTPRPQSTSTHAVAIPPTPSCTRTSFAPSPSLDATLYSPGVTHLDQGVSYYRVYGRSIDEIRRQMRSCSPLASEGNAAASYAQLEYSYTVVRSAGICRVSDAHVVLYSARMLPTWTADDQSPGSVTTKWNQFISATATHENGHTAIDLDYANRMVAALNRTVTDDCILVDKLAMESANAVRAQLNSAQSAYDARTRHSVTQGASF